MSSKTQNEFAEKSDFGVRMRAVFDNISNQAIASKIGVGKSTLTAYMQGRIPPPDKLIEIARLTKCNLNWLLTGEGTKSNTPQIERPQGIVIQGSKGGIGSTFSAVMIASNLALRGYGVLLAADVLQTISRLILGNLHAGAKDKSLTDELSQSPSNLYISTKHQKLDFLIPSFWKKYDYPKETTKKFDFNFSEINKRYQFVIFDVQKMENPFSYPHYYLERAFPLEPVIRNAQVLTTYQPTVSYIEQVESTIGYAQKQKEVYPDAGFLGTIITNRWGAYKKDHPEYVEALAELKETVGAKLFKTEVEYHKELTDKYEKVRDRMFSRKTRIFHNFSQLTDELLDKLDFKNRR